MSVDETKTLLRKGIHAAEQSVQTLAQLDGQVGETLDLARYTTHDSRHTHVTTGLARLTEAGQETAIVHKRLSGSISNGREYLDVIG